MSTRRLELRLSLAVSVALASGAEAQTDHTPADARFMQGMIVHHAQAIAMAELVAERRVSTEARRLAERIAVAQSGEIGMMRRWLNVRGEPERGHPEHTTMPGMLSAEEMKQLAAAADSTFERRFLEGMIRHHEGALHMVRELVASPGSGREPALWEFLTEIEMTQGLEIDQMRRMLASLSKGG